VFLRCFDGCDVGAFPSFLAPTAVAKGQPLYRLELAALTARSADPTSGASAWQT
jgi:hypothetical protein